MRNSLIPPGGGGGFVYGAEEKWASAVTSGREGEGLCGLLRFITGSLCSIIVFFLWLLILRANVREIRD